MFKYIKYWYVLLFFISLLFYAYNDLITSDQAGYRDMDRGYIYKYYGIMIMLVIIYAAIFANRYIRYTSVTKILVAISLWIIFVNLTSSSDRWFSIIHISNSILWIASYHFFYSYLNRNPLSLNLMICLFILVFVFYVWANMFVRNNITSTYDIECVVSGFSYYLILFVPYIGLISNSKIRNILWAITLCLVITSFKRGPIIILPMMFIVYLITNILIGEKKIKYITKLVFSVIIIGVLLFVIDHQSGGYISYRFNQEQLQNGSGRSELWEMALNNIAQRDILQFILGAGSGSSVQLVGTGIHNEWLEFLFSFGIIGIFLYAILCIVLLKQYIYFIKIKSKIAPQFAMMVIYVLIVGLFSGMYFQYSTIYIFSFIGICEYLSSESRRKMHYETKLNVQYL